MRSTHCKNNRFLKIIQINLTVEREYGLEPMQGRKNKVDEANRQSAAATFLTYAG